MAQQAVDLLRAGVRANHADPLRQGNLVRLSGPGTLVIAGDLHGHGRNLERVTAFADLARSPDRHLVLQEIIHGGPQDPQGGCLSYKVLLDAVRLKLRFPNQVHIVLGNHDTAWITGSEVVKEGREMNKAMSLALAGEYGEDWPLVAEAIREFFLSQPLAVRTENRVWVSHSLPSDRMVDQFDPQVLDRPLQVSDYVKPGSAYILTWGRHMSQSLLDRMSNLFNVDLFVVGHQPQPEGWDLGGTNLLVLASDHNHGCLIELDLARPYSLEGLVQALVPLSSIA
ncbi:MAG: metallophosphoesterase [Phycisphaerae bacterium]|nr:metallophosphoesterase [Phycisphaerae bacterium]